MTLTNFAVNCLRAKLEMTLEDKLGEIIKRLEKIEHNMKNIIKISFNDCQPKTIGFRVSTSNLGHLHG